MVPQFARVSITVAGFCLVAPVVSAQSASLPAGGYTAPFDSMGAAGTTPPLGWTHLTLAGTATTFTAATGIPAASVTGGTLSTGLTATLDPTASNINGYNAATSAAPTVRSLGTAPTGVAASVLEIRLTNNSGISLTQLSLSYDTRRFTPSDPGELPGYQVFFSQDNGITYTNIPDLNPGRVGSGAPIIFDATTGLTTVSNFPLTLPTQVAVGADIYLRFVDDNADVISPDQILGMERFVFVPVPEPTTVLGGSALVLLAGRFLRRKVVRTARRTPVT